MNKRSHFQELPKAQFIGFKKSCFNVSSRHHGGQILEILPHSLPPTAHAMICHGGRPPAMLIPSRVLTSKTITTTVPPHFKKTAPKRRPEMTLGEHPYTNALATNIPAPDNDRQQQEKASAVRTTAY